MTTELIKPAHRSKATRRSHWTPERRAAAAARARMHRPWEKSTGSRTAAGKGRAKMNGLVHGGRSTGHAELRAALREYARYLRCARLMT